MTDARRAEFVAALEAIRRVEHLHRMDERTESEVDRAYANAIAAYDAATAVQGGEWVMVPREPTEAMCRAAVIYANGNAVYKNVAAEALRIEEGIYSEVYAAMTAAAPPVQVCGYCDGSGEIETDNNGPIVPCPVCKAPPAARQEEGSEVEYELWQGDEMVAGASGAAALDEVRHYAMVYSQDGPVTIKRVVRTVVAMSAQKAGK